MWVAKTGLDAQQTRMAVISNNLANVNTAGFKRDRALFEDLLYQNIRQAGGQTGVDTQAPTGMMLGTGTRIVATEKLHSQGSLINTENALDIAIQGEGFFQILQPDGTLAYTRDGSFKLSNIGEVVTSTGARLQPPLTVPQNVSSLTIGADGTVSASLFGGGAQQLGNFQTTRFLNPAGLEPLGRNLFRETAASGPPQVLTPGQNGAGQLVQGALSWKRW
jgi:flagellar basal-body rod protein FlgG